MSEYDESGRLVLVEDTEHDVIVSLEADGGDSILLTLRSELGRPAEPDAGICDGSSYPGSLAAPERATVRDRFGYWNRTAESFAAHWLSFHAGWDLGRHGGVAAWGPGGTWHDVAERQGILVDGSPGPGAVAQSHLGFGHVAIVVRVADDTVTVCDYDHAMSGEFQRRVVPSATYRYLHPTGGRAPLRLTAG